MRTLKESLRQVVVSLARNALRHELDRLIGWYNEHRAHSGLAGRTPNEVYFARRPGNRLARIEPRPNWPRGSPCAKPQVLIAGQPGARFAIDLSRIDGLAHLPIVKLRRAG